MLAENNESSTPTTEELQEWAETYGINHPLVADPGYGEAFFMNGYLPSMALLSEGAVIVATSNSSSELDLEASLPSEQE